MSSPFHALLDPLEGSFNADFSSFVISNGFDDKISLTFCLWESLDKINVTVPETTRQ